MNHRSLIRDLLERSFATGVGGPLVPALLAFAIWGGSALSAPQPVLADGPNGTACVSVKHSYPPTTDEDPVNDQHDVATAGINGQSYRVTYRLHRVDGGDHDWSEWMTPGEKAQSSTRLGTFIYLYTTADHDLSRYDMVEFQVWLHHHPGIDTHTGERVWGDQGEVFQNTMLLLDPGPCDGSVPTQWNWFWAPYQKCYVGSTLSVAPGLASRVSPALISDALANPDAISGYNRLDNLNLPEGPQNSLRTCLNLSNPNVAWHPLFNGLVFTAGCR